MLSIRPGFWLLAVFLVAGMYRADAQEPAYRHYTLDDGLPSMQIYRIIQDHKGYMWFATDRGVARFDGKEFKTYSVEEGLTENTIFVLKEDPSHRIWFLHFNKSLYYLEGDSIKPYSFNEKISDMVGDKSLLLIDFEVDKDGGIWLGFTGPPYLARIDPKGTVTAQSKQDYDKFCGVINLIDSNRFVLSTTSFSTKNMTFVLNDLQSGTIIESEPVSRVWKPSLRATMSNGKLWVLLGNTVYSTDGTSVRMHKRIANNTHCLLVSDENYFWLPEKNKGWTCYSEDDSSRAVRSFFNHRSILEATNDREGGTWFGTMDDGVYYCPEIATYCLSGISGLPQSGICAVSSWKNRIYAAQTSGLLSSFNSDFSGEVRTEGSFDYINGLCPINDNHLMVSALNMLGEAQEGITDRLVLDFYRARDTIWLSGVGGVAALPSTTLSKTEEQLVCYTGLRMEAIFTETPGKFLLGTLNGLCTLEKGQISHLSDSFPEFKNRITNIERICAKYLVIATRGAGLLFWDGKKVHQVNREAGLADNNCNALVLDENKTPWVGTNRGLDRVVFDTIAGQLVRVEHFGERHGLASADVRGLYIDSNFIWVGGSKGLSRLDRNINYLTDTAVPPVHILSAQLSGKDIHRNQIVSYERNQFEVSYVGVTFKEPNLTRYEYRLLGGDGEWHQTNSNRLTFAGMPPGEYQFEVAAVKSNGSKSRKPAVFEFRIQAPIWQRSFFWPAILSVFSLVVAAIVFRYIERIKQKNVLFREMSRLRESALRNQMNPHFVYNAMNSIQSLILRDEKEKAMNYLTKFAGLLRFSFNTSGKELIPFKEDLEALKLYIDLEQMRYPGNLKVKYSVSALVNDTLVPPLLIQPFVENAVKHGILKSGKEGTVIVGVNIVDEKRLKVHIQDNGSGFEREFIAQKQLSPSGMKVTLDRLNQFNAQNNVSTEFRVESPISGQGNGARIEFVLARKKDEDD